MSLYENNVPDDSGFRKRDPASIDVVKSPLANALSSQLIATKTVTKHLLLMLDVNQVGYLKPFSQTSRQLPRQWPRPWSGNRTAPQQHARALWIADSLPPRRFVSQAAAQCPYKQLLGFVGLRAPPGQVRIPTRTRHRHDRCTRIKLWHACAMQCQAVHLLYPHCQ